MVSFVTDIDWKSWDISSIQLNPPSYFWEHHYFSLPQTVLRSINTLLFKGGGRDGLRRLHLARCSIKLSWYCTLLFYSTPKSCFKLYELLLTKSTDLSPPILTWQADVTSFSSRAFLTSDCARFTWSINIHRLALNLGHVAEKMSYVQYWPRT